MQINALLVKYEVQHDLSINERSLVTQVLHQGFKASKNGFSLFDEFSGVLVICYQFTCDIRMSVTGVEATFYPIYNNWIIYITLVPS